MPKCKYCGGRSSTKEMTHKLNWRGTYNWYHPACAAARSTEKREAAAEEKREEREAAEEKKRQAEAAKREQAPVVAAPPSVVPAPAPSPRPPESVEFDFPAEVVFRAAAEGIPTLDGFEVKDANRIARPRRLSVKTKRSLKSWGEKFTVSVIEVTPRSASMLIESAQKTVVGTYSKSMLTSKGGEHIGQIIRATSDQLDQYGVAWTNELGVPPLDASEPESPSIEERLRRLEALHEQGLINQDDFEARKQAILSEL
jgi:hypothetical protein